MRVPFDQIFERLPDGSISPRVNVSLDGVAVAQGVPLDPDITLGGINFHSLIGHDLDIELQGDLHKIKGHFE